MKPDPKMKPFTDLVIDSGASLVPDDVRKILAFLVFDTADKYVLKQGATCLYWSLIANIGQHIEQDELGPKRKPAGDDVATRPGASADAEGGSVPQTEPTTSETEQIRG